MKKNMEENFKMLFDRAYGTCLTSDLKKISEELKKIKGPTICVGSGGSRVVADFVSKVLAEKNNILTTTMDPRDLLYNKSVKHYDNIFVCSYSGKNHGVGTALSLNKNKYLLTNSTEEKEGVKLLTYTSKEPKEKSFISLGATLMPIAIMYEYYYSDSFPFGRIMEYLLDQHYEYEVGENKNFEIMSGFDTSVASNYLESTIVEAGLGMCTLHNKYDYCHGRTTLGFHHDNTLIYLKAGETELDNLLIDEVKKLYDEIIILEGRRASDNITNNFDLLVKAMWLTRSIALKQRKDLSGVDYSPLCRKLYPFKGKM